MYEKPSNKTEEEIFTFLTQTAPSLCANDVSWATAKELGVVGMKASDASRVLRDNGFVELAAAIKALQKTEGYIRFGGGVTVRSYKVFNPATGTYDEYATEEEARAAYVNACNAFLANGGPSMIQEIVNQYEEATWVSYDITPTVTVS